MLALFKTAAVQLLVSNTSDQTTELEDLLSWEIEPTVTLNVHNIRHLVPTLPAITWGGVADACTRATTPVYEAVRKTFHDDIDHLAQLFADLEPMSLADYEIEESVCVTAVEESLLSMGLAEPERPLARLSDPPPRPTRKRRKSDPELDEVLIIPSTGPSIPTIVVTTCPTLPRDRSCMVPYQDVSFGNRLAVPTHPVLNGVYPPLLPKAVPYVDKWCFRDGHWWAVLPPLEEQMKKNMFSRPVSRRRRISLGDSWHRPFRTRQPPHSHALHRSA